MHRFYSMGVQHVLLGEWVLRQVGRMGAGGGDSVRL
jgi:predicted DNA-binding WGR domain protein